MPTALKTLELIGKILESLLRVRHCNRGCISQRDQAERRLANRRVEARVFTSWRGAESAAARTTCGLAAMTLPASRGPLVTTPTSPDNIRPATIDSVTARILGILSLLFCCVSRCSFRSPSQLSLSAGPRHAISARSSNPPTEPDIARRGKLGGPTQSRSGF